MMLRGKKVTRVTAELLESLDACAIGKTRFMTVFPEGLPITRASCREVVATGMWGGIEWFVGHISKDRQAVFYAACYAADEAYYRNLDEIHAEARWIRGHTDALWAAVRP